MTKKSINVGAEANDNKGDSLRSAFTKINDNFDELYTALGINADVNLNLGAFEFAGSVLSTTDSSAIVIDQAVTVSSNLTVGGDVLPSVANDGDLGSSTRPWKSLYVSNNTIFLGGVPIGLDANGNLTVNGGQVNAPSSTLVNGSKTVSLGSDGLLNVAGPVTLPNTGELRPSTTAYDAALAGWEFIRGGEIANRIAIGQALVQYYPMVNWHPTGATAQSYLDFLLNAWTLQNTGGATLIIQPPMSSAFYAQLRASLNLIKNTYSSIGSGVSIAAGYNKSWHFNNEGDLTIPGDIKSNGNINIDINLADSTLRRWQFGEDGDTVFPNNVAIRSNGAGYRGLVGDPGISLSLVGSGEGSAGIVWNDNATSPTQQAAVSVDNYGIGRKVNASILTQGHGNPARTWKFDEDGKLTLPSVGKISNGAYDWTFGSDGVLTVPHSIFGNGTSLALSTGATAPGAAVAINTSEVNFNFSDARGGFKFKNLGGATGSITFPDSTVQTTAWNGTTAGAITAGSFNTDQITVVGNRISTTVTNANLEIECNGTGRVVINAIEDATTASTTRSVGYLGLPQSATATTATLAIGDAGKHIYVTTASQTMTIPANGTVAYPIGTTLTFIAGPSATTVSIAITTDTMYLAGTGTTGTRTLAAHGMATAVKVAATTWYINGTGLT